MKGKRKRKREKMKKKKKMKEEDEEEEEEEEEENWCVLSRYSEVEMEKPLSDGVPALRALPSRAWGPLEAFPLNAPWPLDPFSCFPMPADRSAVDGFPALSSRPQNPPNHGQSLSFQRFAAAAEERPLPVTFPEEPYSADTCTVEVFSALRSSRKRN
jgi:hypothetical protein